MPHRWDSGYVSQLSPPWPRLATSEEIVGFTIKEWASYQPNGVSWGCGKNTNGKRKKPWKTQLPAMFFLFFWHKQNIASPRIDVFFCGFRCLCDCCCRKSLLIPFDQLMYESTVFVETEVWLVCLSLSMYRSSLIYWAVLSDFPNGSPRIFPTKWCGKVSLTKWG